MDEETTGKARFLLALLFQGDEEDKALASQNFHSPKANIIVFRAKPEKLPDFFTFHYTYNFSSLVFTVKNCTALLCGAGYV